MEKILISDSIWKALDKCRSTDEAREAIRTIHVTKDHIETTDGRMLLRAYLADNGAISASPAGVYNVISSAKFGGGLVQVILEKTEYDYPNTDRVIPAAGNSSEAITVELKEERSAPGYNLSRALAKIFRHTGAALNYEFLKRLAPMAEAWTVSNKSADVVRLDIERASFRFTAVIMPIKLED